MKNIKNLTEFRKYSLKTKIVIAIAAMGITFVSVGGFNNANYKNSTSSMDKNIKVLGSVYTTQYGVTTASALSVRSGAGTNYAILGSMKSGTKVIITGKTNNFYKVTYNSKTAYISTQYVKITAKPVVVVTPPMEYTTQYGVTTTNTLSVRSGAGTNYAVLGSMASGTKVIITGKTNNFYKVTYNSKTAYISAQYVKITAKPVVLPAVYGGRVYSTLNVRSGAGTNYSIIGSVKSSTIVMISGEINNFYKIAYNDKIGYVSADYVLPVGSKVTD
ncbi:SH3 domain-containing protein [Clostridium estertheticum]|uniref:SH3 domain-containing protein n=1 Tax=Clostridium estertheticum TaxID=238834 RepID=UPI001C0C5160|nr:SH3 domain-containing protein [Clostridium estertheticum]MBU3215585.1 SH3 domain-containing protein [Clostridium estertheticum]WAG56797.1 SH3 domain-containing protein [Clostridium estertheticum]